MTWVSALPSGDHAGLDQQLAAQLQRVMEPSLRSGIFGAVLLAEGFQDGLDGGGAFGAGFPRRISAPPNVELAATYRSSNPPSPSPAGMLRPPPFEGGGGEDLQVVQGRARYRGHRAGSAR